MEFFEALKARHSVRAYADTPVEAEKLDQVRKKIGKCVF